MSTAARWVVMALLTVHGLIHLLGAAKGLGWAPVEALKEPISHTLGLAWLTAALLVLTAVLMIALRVPWWWLVAAVAAALSQAVIATSWGDAKAGTAANLLLVVVAVLGFAATGPGSFAATYDARVDEALTAAPHPGPVVTDADLEALPAPLAAYLRRSGVVGKPRVTSFAATVHGRIRSGPDTPWMPFTGRQVNTFGADPQRVFYLDATRAGLPVVVVHDYHHATATMRGKVLSLFPILDAAGPEMDRGETVTVFNDMVVFAPAALLDAPVTWIQLDDHRVRGTFTNQTQTVTAELRFDAVGDLVTFVSGDRARASADGSAFVRLPWDTPITAFRDIDGRRIAVSGEGKWDAPEPDGHFTYVDFHIDDITYNPAPDAVTGRAMRRIAAHRRPGASAQRTQPPQPAPSAATKG
jgi:hypothetical protein